MLLSLVTFLLAASATAAPASRQNSAPHERRSHVPSLWSRHAKPHPSTPIPLRIALAQRNLHRAEEFILSVSSPSSPDYGKHWTAEKVTETFGPSEESVTKVLEWLDKEGIDVSRVGRNQRGKGSWLSVSNATVEEAERVLGAEYWVYKHGETGQSWVGCEEYGVHENVREHVDFVTPTVHFDAKVKPRKEKRSLKAESGVALASGEDRAVASAAAVQAVVAGDLGDCFEAITPDCLRALYDIPAQAPYNETNSFGIVEFGGAAYLPGDLDMFFANFSPAAVGSRPIFKSIDGGFLQDKYVNFAYQAESDLDLEYAMGLTYPQNVTLYQVGDFLDGGSENSLLDAFDSSYCTFEGGDDPAIDPIYPDDFPGSYGAYTGPQTCGGFAAANVISISYEYDEIELTPFYANRQCMEYMKLGLQGVSFLFDSGDFGVSGSRNKCLDPVTGKDNFGLDGRFSPTFPSTCPYITAVGATRLPVNGTVYDREIAASGSFRSGGGFSNIFQMPAYQSSAVTSYLTNNPPPYNSSQYNNTGNARGYPDVSAAGVDFLVAIEGQFTYVGGTSASAPTFASVLTMVNAERLNRGKGPVGFVNPVLYANPGVLNDVVSGSNSGCGTNGFEAAVGWDPVTGLGTPSFKRMVEVWLALP